MKNILITGANRGIGLMFAQSFSSIANTVYATVRDLNNCDELKKIKNVEILELDLLSKNSIKTFCSELKDIPLDLILNNAGVFQDEQMEETNLDPDLWLDEVMINAVGPMTLTQKLRENLMSGVEKKVIFISSQMGSVDDNHSGGYYFYRTSKSALNSAARSLAIDWKADNISVLMLHPGWVKTDMGGLKAKLEIEESVSCMLKVINALDISKTGSFVNYDGKKLEW
jgi:NAD(P)-dependent dehydrogenase (short-subunit alcohol dehydrogenase family)|tara:strand:+ start:8430 stop:9110 length:681 start_codon:yes stop_codon:yes gene_type:complete